ncbi:MAG: type II toxin-antitoxin system RelE/ParE family toxin [Sterolibacterium sp.]
MAKKVVVQPAGNFERNLAGIERFPTEAEAPHTYDALLDDLVDSVIPHLERFPAMGRPFLSRAPCSVEATTALEALRAKLSALVPDPDGLREYIMDNYLVLYALIGGNVHLLAIKHHRQLSFDFQGHWGATSSMP